MHGPITVNEASAAEARQRWAATPLAFSCYTFAQHHVATRSIRSGHHGIQLGQAFQSPTRLSKAQVRSLLHR
jgi:hypothetical protein